MTSCRSRFPRKGSGSRPPRPPASCRSRLNSIFHPQHSLNTPVRSLSWAIRLIQGLMSLRPAEGSPASRPLDVVFPVLHGPFGEDGTLQGLLEMADIPYVGCGVLASSCGMDKVAMKQLFQVAGLPMCQSRVVSAIQWQSDRSSVTRTVKREIGFPCFVKPANLVLQSAFPKPTIRPHLSERSIWRLNTIVK